VAADGRESARVQATEGGHVCRNCGALATAPFCGQCGQSTDDRPLTVRDILSDIVEDQLSVNGSTLRTFSLLIRPGFLTQEYLRGRIVRYLAPFRLFLLSTTFFLLIAAFTAHRQERRMVAAAKAAIQDQATRDTHPGRPTRPFRILQAPIDSAWLPAPLRGIVRPMLRKQAEINAMPLERSLPIVMGAFLRASSYIIPLLVPGTAGLLALLYGRRHRPFAEHLVFTLHTHAFAFLVLGLGMLAQLAWMPLNHVSNVLTLIYLYFALVRVYGNGWLWTIPRLIALVGLYFGLMTLASPLLQIALLALA